MSRISAKARHLLGTVCEPCLQPCKLDQETASLYSEQKEEGDSQAR